MNLSYVAELPTAGSNLSHRFKLKIKDCRVFKFIKLGPRSIWRICEPRKFVSSDVTNETAELQIVTK